MPVEHRPTEVSHFIRRARIKRNWLQQDVADRCGWPQSKVSRLETGAMPPGIDELEIISKVFEVPLGRLLQLRKRAA